MRDRFLLRHFHRLPVRHAFLLRLSLHRLSSSHQIFQNVLGAREREVAEHYRKLRIGHLGLCRRANHHQAPLEAAALAVRSGSASSNFRSASKKNRIGGNLLVK